MSNISEPWFGYDLSKYTIADFIYAIFNDIFVSKILEFKKSNVNTLFKPFIKEVRWEYDNFRPFELPSNLNSIKGETKIVEKWCLLNWKGIKEIEKHFTSYWEYVGLINKLDEEFSKKTNEILNLIIRSLILFNPSKLSLEEKDVSKILGDYGKPLSPKIKLIRKYVKKFSAVFKNVQIYNPRRFSIDKPNYTQEDGLFALGEAINRATTKLSYVESSHLWSGKKSLNNHFDNKDENKEHQLTKQERESKSKIKVLNNGTRVMATRDDLNLYLNESDYFSYDFGITRGNKKINLNLLREKVANIIPVPEMKSGEAWLIDKRSINIEYYLPSCKNKLNEKCKIYAQFIISIFDNFAGCLLMPSNTFIETI